MSSSKIKNLFLLGFICCAFGCQAGKEFHREVIPAGSPNGPAAKNPAPFPELSSNGGSHTGGGNGVQGKTLDIFIIDISSKSEFKNILAPLISKLADKVPELASDLLHIARARKWYFVPVELNTLPASQIGVTFKTEQLAIHKKETIWVSTVRYDEMNEADKAALLLHEMVMGVRLLDLQEALDQCLAKTQIYFLKNQPDEFQKSRKDCYNKHNNPLDKGRELRLGDGEHDDIRNLTSMLLNQIDTIEAFELQGWIKTKKFRHW